MRVFGFVAYQHVLGQLKKKLDDKGEVIILVGYHSTGGYKLFDAVKMRVVNIQDVIVDEIKDMQHHVTGYVKVVIGYVKVVTGYNFENSYSA